MKLTIILLSLIIFLSCNDENKRTIHLIEKGNDSSNEREIKFFTGDELKFKAIFTESCKYKLSPDEAMNIHKLRGFSTCGSHHLDNSIRFGWRWQDSLTIHTYEINQSDTSSIYICTVDIGKEYNYSIKETDSNYIFKVDSVKIKKDKVTKCYSNVSYNLFPYFESKGKAPHDISIIITE